MLNETELTYTFKEHLNFIDEALVMWNENKEIPTSFWDDIMTSSRHLKHSFYEFKDIIDINMGSFRQNFNNFKP